jgi:nucleoside-diphosphate-sugar epimerase
VLNFYPYGSKRNFQGRTVKALITGGAGFIGSHLTERLLGDGNKVVVVDNLSTGSLKNIEALKSKPAFDFVEGDVRNAELVERLVEQCDVIFHLAAAVGVQLIADKPVHTIETNIGGMEAVLERIREAIGWQPRTRLSEALGVIIEDKTLGKTEG